MLHSSRPLNTPLRFRPSGIDWPAVFGTAAQYLSSCVDDPTNEAFAVLWQDNLLLGLTDTVHLEKRLSEFAKGVPEGASPQEQRAWGPGSPYTALRMVVDTVCQSMRALGAEPIFSKTLPEFYWRPRTLRKGGYGQCVEASVHRELLRSGQHLKINAPLSWRDSTGRDPYIAPVRGPKNQSRVSK